MIHRAAEEAEGMTTSSFLCVTKAADKTGVSLRKERIGQRSLAGQSHLHNQCLECVCVCVCMSVLD